MDIQEYVNQQKEIQTHILSYLEDESEVATNFQNLIDLIDSTEILKNQDECRLLLRLISKISKNHHRGLDTIKKTEKILTHYKDQIKQTLSNTVIFNIFKSNMLILLFLFENDFIKPDQLIAQYLLSTNSSFFYPEIKNLIDETARKDIESRLLGIDDQIFDHFDEKRRIGENDSYLCELIRTDSVEDFIIYVNKKNLRLTSTINKSIFETNQFLINRRTSLIEYSAFYGSIQIFQYLKMNDVSLTPALWLYAIHGKNAEMIHILEEEKIKPNDESFQECLKEAIKCHHNDIGHYIKDNLLDEKVEEMNLTSQVPKNSAYYCFHNYNYDFFSDVYPKDIIYFYSCKYDYLKIVELLIKENSVDINAEIKVTFYNLPAICLAAQKNHYRIVNFLIKAGVEMKPFLFRKCSKLTHVSLYPNVNKISNGLFMECSSLVDVFIPSSITMIEDAAFKDCSSLTKIEIPSSVTSIKREAFQNCTLITEISIPSSVTVIENEVFKNCSSLKKIVIPASVKSIGIEAFKDCVSLINDIIIPSSVKEIKNGAFENCKSLKIISIPSSVKLIGSCAFKNCISLTKISIPQSVLVIEDQTFYNCSSLTEISFSSYLKSIGAEAFYLCKLLTKIDIPETVSSIGAGAFNGCELIQEISIPENVTQINDFTFKCCKNLKQIKIGNSIEKIGKSAFIECKLIDKFLLPSTVTKIEEGAFTKCHSLKEFIIPPQSNLISIERAAFYECKSLTQMIIPSSVVKIGSSSFSCCTSLSQIIFEGKSSVSEIGTYAFYRCNLLEKIEIPPNVKIIERNTFLGCSSLTEALIPSTLKYITPNSFEVCTKIVEY